MFCSYLQLLEIKTNITGAKKVLIGFVKIKIFFLNGPVAIAGAINPKACGQAHLMAAIRAGAHGNNDRLVGVVTAGDANLFVAIFIRFGVGCLRKGKSAERWDEEAERCGNKEAAN